jgi:hypothetical protein
VRKDLNVKKYIGAFFKFVIAAVVMAFLGLKSLDFFYFVTPADQFYYAYLGFGLTGGGVIAYLVIFLWDAETALKKTIAISMLAFCVIGELATAGFGLQINAWKSGGFHLTDSDFNSMILVIQLLGFVHAAALIGYVAGDQIMWAFQDDDGDHIPNELDPVDNRTGQPTRKPKFSFFGKKKEVVRQPEPIKQVTIPEDVYKQLLIDAGIGQGSNNNHKAEQDFTSRQSQK